MLGFRLINSIGSSIFSGQLSYSVSWVSLVSWLVGWLIRKGLPGVRAALFITVPEF